MAQDERAVLRVEGKDDKYVIENLLSRHGITSVPHFWRF